MHVPAAGIGLPRPPQRSRRCIRQPPTPPSSRCASRSSAARGGSRIALVGLPNSGKSTLFACRGEHLGANRRVGGHAQRLQRMRGADRPRRGPGDRSAEHPLAASSRVAGPRGAQIPAVGRRASARFAARTGRPAGAVCGPGRHRAGGRRHGARASPGAHVEAREVRTPAGDRAQQDGRSRRARHVRERSRAERASRRARGAHRSDQGSRHRRAVPRGGAGGARWLGPACAAAERAHHRGARAARVALEHAGDPAGLSRAAAIARDADRGRRSVLSRRNAAALSRVPAGTAAAARARRAGAAAPLDGRAARRPSPSRGHAVRGGDPSRPAGRRPRLALLARRIVPEPALGLHRQRRRVRRRPVRRVLRQRLDRQRDVGAPRDVGGDVAAGVYRRRRRPRRGRRPDRARRHRRAVHDPARAAAGGAGRDRRHGAHRVRRRPDVPPDRAARRRRGAVPARAGLQRAGDCRHRQHDQRAASA